MVAKSIGPRSFALVVVLAFFALFRVDPVAARPAHPDAWIVIETDDFTLLSDADPRVAREVAFRLEEFRDAFARLSPALELRSPAPTTLFAFRDAVSYAPYKSRADRDGSRVLGQFLRTRDGNYLTLDAGSELADAFTVLYHEYVHFLVLHNFPRVPLWFNEGLAEYYSTFTVRDGRAVVGRGVDRHLRLLAAEGDFSIAELLEADTTSDAYHDPDEVGRFYALSWLMVHYLLSGGGEEVERIADYFLRLEDGESPDRAFEDAFGRGLDSFEAELQTYLSQGRFATAGYALPKRGSVSQGRRLSAADTLYHLGDLLVRLGRDGEAESHFHGALERDPRHADAHAGLAHVRDRQQRLTEAEPLYRDALRLGSRRALTHLLYGRHSLALASLAPTTGGGEAGSSAVENARRVLARGIDLDPNFGEIHALLGIAHLESGGDLDSALSSLARARRLLPQRLDLVALQVKTHLRRGEIDRATEILGHELQPFDDDLERVADLWEDVDRTRLLLGAQKAFERGETDEGLRLFDEAVDLTTDEALRARLEDELLRLQREAGR